MFDEAPPYLHSKSDHAGWQIGLLSHSCLWKELYTWIFHLATGLDSSTGKILVLEMYKHGKESYEFRNKFQEK